MRLISFRFVCLVFATVGCSGHAQQPLCPKHIEPPFYPAIARMAHVSGTVRLTLTIDKDGHVLEAKAASDSDKLAAIFERDANSNIRQWTFANPSASTHQQTIVFRYLIDDSHADAPTTATYDLPEQVTIKTGSALVNVSY